MDHSIPERKILRKVFERIKDVLKILQHWNSIDSAGKVSEIVCVRPMDASQVNHLRNALKNILKLGLVVSRKNGV